MAVNASGGTPVSPAAFSILQLFYRTSESLPYDGVIELSHDASLLLWDMF